MFFFSYELFLNLHCFHHWQQFQWTSLELYYYVLMHAQPMYLCDFNREFIICTFFHYPTTLLLHHNHGVGTTIKEFFQGRYMTEAILFCLEARTRNQCYIITLFCWFEVISCVHMHSTKQTHYRKARKIAMLLCCAGLSSYFFFSSLACFFHQ